MGKLHAFLEILLNLYRPPEFRGMCPTVAVAFLLGRTDNFLRNLAVDALLEEILKGFLHNPVLAGVEGQNGGAATWP